ncbi:MAG: hypothetical protein JWN75_297 [Candidatus Saccharibacteria bacterium]|nr:hypothetical protein [Candidatus Saccharibacteria bacterium]
MATYNCADSSSNAYGDGSFGTCSTQTVGAPNTGVFEQIISGGSFTIIAPLVTAIIVVVIASLIVRRQRKQS